MMERAIELSKRGRGNVSPNPLVGCVIVYNNTIISNGKRVVVGDEFGEVYVWEEDLFNRRVSSEQPEEDDARRQTMRERLNALRKR